MENIIFSALAIPKPKWNYHSESSLSDWIKINHLYWNNHGKYNLLHSITLTTSCCISIFQYAIDIAKLWHSHDCKIKKKYTSPLTPVIKHLSRILCEINTCFNENHSNITFQDDNELVAFISNNNKFKSCNNNISICIFKIIHNRQEILHICQSDVKILLKQRYIGYAYHRNDDALILLPWCYNDPVKQFELKNGIKEKSLWNQTTNPGFEYNGVQIKPVPKPTPRDPSNITIRYL